MHPYPAHLVKNLILADGTPVTLRPIRPTDALIEQKFVRGLSAEARYFRFMDMVRELSPQMLKHLTDIDYYNHMALIAVARVDSREIEIAVGRYVVHPDQQQCEFAIVVADGWRHRGIATELMKMLIELARERGLKTMIGEVLASNHNMLAFVRELGFDVAMDAADPRQMRATLQLQAA